jgi:hypothetical protein
MRYQERIYIQNQNSVVRNRALTNVNMSSDFCVFNSPLFNVSGATKIDCTGTTTDGKYIISANTQTIPLTFQFTANTASFLQTDANFRYEIYKYDEGLNGFGTIPVYKSDRLNYSAFSATNETTQLVPSSGLTMDGDYLVKGFYQFSACTNFLKLLGKGIDTINYISGQEYGIYNNNLDYYFVAIKEAEKPLFTNNTSNSVAANRLIQTTVLPPAGITDIAIPSNLIGDFILTLNGLVLANGYDYSFSITGGVVTLTAQTLTDDIITFTYTSLGGNNLNSDSISITMPIVSGVTDGEGSNLVYFNTTTQKYEIYTSITPLQSNDIIVILNGATLANGIDYYQSTSNPKRIILEGSLLVGDIITMVYFPTTNTVNGLNTSTPVVSWQIENPPQKANGYFSLEVSTGNTFSSFYYSGKSDYFVGETLYADTFVATGTVGTTLYYRVKNEKNYETLCGNLLTTTTYSDTIPIIIQSNSINSY